MSTWGEHTFGDPCRGCGYRWSLSASEAATVIGDAQHAFGQLLVTADGQETCGDLAWNVAAYVSHVADNLRIWAERLAAAASGATAPVTAYDSDALAAARAYGHLPLAGAVWLLGESARSWRRAWDSATAQGATLRHPERGVITVADVARTNAHDVEHHRWDVERCLRAARERTAPEVG